MLNINYLKSSPTTYVLKYKQGKVVKRGAGLSFYYYAPKTTVVTIPLEAKESNFMFHEYTEDFQEVSVQGAITFKVTEPAKLSTSLNYSLNKKGTSYASNDPEKLENILIKIVQVAARKIIQTKALKNCLQLTSKINSLMLQETQLNPILQGLGIEIIDLSILAIKPNPETQRALEASMREQILLEADQAVYLRRNSAVEQERIIKENELETEKSIEEKQQQIRDAQLDADRQYKQKARLIQQEAMADKIRLEDKNKELVALVTENAKEHANAKAYAVEASVRALDKLETKKLEALTMANLDPQKLMALAFKELAQNNSIGQLNISPDLLQSIMEIKEA